MNAFSSLSSDRFVDALRRGTDAMWSLDAAVWLLERHGVWLESPELRNFVQGGVDEDGEMWAGFDVRPIREAIDSGGFGEWREDLAVLMVAMSLYGDFPIALRYTCENLSLENLALISEALFKACGYKVRLAVAAGDGDS
ncbi:hypothetical protein [Streptomyces sp. MI02-7b]|uniref:hypothetical protein n=1 Tax=Streptomyces sp. MI02-7b TaxID=462941 RepID=UPI0029A8464D|nr:hypothetical protein [Streptomyces sp. MI02-7b]MDX3076905.1 hypothetical protein [Streptomyces sp. MI02-7b]